MTPLLPTPDYYLHNLITMTSSESKRLWRRAIKEHFNCQCVYCGGFYELHNLTIDHVRPKTRVAHLCQDIVPIQTLLPKENASNSKTNRFGFFKK